MLGLDEEAGTMTDAILWFLAVPVVVAFGFLVIWLGSKGGNG